MSEQNARDPYLGLNNHIRQQARAQIPSGCTVGTVLSVQPLLIRAAGLDLDKDDLRIARHLLPGWTELLSGLGWSLTASLPTKTLSGTCTVTVNGSSCSGTCQVSRPAESVSGTTAAQASATHADVLQAGDEVLLLVSEDGQTFYVIDKLVEVET